MQPTLSASAFRRRPLALDMASSQAIVKAWQRGITIHKRRLAPGFQRYIPRLGLLRARAIPHCAYRPGRWRCLFSSAGLPKRGCGRVGSTLTIYAAALVKSRQITWCDQQVSLFRRDRGQASLTYLPLIIFCGWYSRRLHESSTYLDHTNPQRKCPKRSRCKHREHCFRCDVMERLTTANYAASPYVANPDSAIPAALCSR